MMAVLLLVAFAAMAAPPLPEPAETLFADPDTTVTDTDSASASLADSLSAPIPAPSAAGHAVDSTVLKLEKVTVTGNRKPDYSRNAALDATVVELKAKHNAPTELKEAIQAAPGMHIRQNGGIGSDFDLNINGLQGKAIRVFLDGVPLDARSAALALSTLSVEDLDRVELYKGVLPAEMGSDALGGGLNLVTRSIRRDAVETSYQTGSFGELRLQGRIHKKLGEHAFLRLEGGWGQAENDFPVEVLAMDPVTRKQVNQTVDRFHDGYGLTNFEGRLGSQRIPVLGGLEAGLKWHAWDREYQHGASAFAPYGKVEGRVRELSPKLEWSRAWMGEMLAAQFRTDYSWSRSARVDTSSLQFFWDGKSQASARDGGEVDPAYKSLAEIQSHTVSTRTSLRFNLDSSRALVLNHVWLGLERYGEDPLGERLRDGTDPLTIPGIYHRHFSTLAWQSRQAGMVPGYELMAKHYAYMLEGPEADFGYWSGDIIDQGGSYFGGAAAVKRSLAGALTVRLAYERGLRFPDQDEILGDGFFQLANYHLAPEHSHNLNLGTAWTNGLKGKGRLSADVNLFARLQRDLIVIRPQGFIFSIHRNEDKAQSLGAEWALGWQPWQGGRVDLNATHQDIRKKSYADPAEKYLLDSRIPNIPFFFGNLALGHQFKSLLASTDGLEFSWNARYVHDFLLYPIPKSREGRFFWRKPDVKTEYLIPAQLTQNLGLTYHFPGRWLSLGTEVRNVFDEVVYDNFRVPKPGRSFHAKLGLKH